MGMLRVVRRLCLLCCFVFYGVSVALAAEERSAVDQPFLLVEDPWPPYTLGENGGAPHGGLMVELMD